MPKGILIPVDNDLPMELKDFDGLKPLQDAVGGLIEPIDLDRPSATLFVNEEGHYLDLAINRRATLITWLHNTRYRGHAPVIGDTVLIGRADDEGKTKDAPSWYAKLFFDTEHFKVQMQTLDDMLWRQHDRVFDDWQQAYTSILIAAERNALAANVRVVPA